MMVWTYLGAVEFLSTKNRSGDLSARRRAFLQHAHVGGDFRESGLFGRFAPQVKTA